LHFKYKLFLRQDSERQFDGWRVLAMLLSGIDVIAFCHAVMNTNGQFLGYNLVSEPMAQMIIRDSLQANFTPLKLESVLKFLLVFLGYD
jgi:hypothetical protein